ncbi:MAG: flavin reductase family protein [Flavobacteriales bacterium]|nr:flavin reductase family protein [Flavobacteriales bacterium]
MITLTPTELGTQKTHQYLLGAIGPRPIAFASTIDKAGKRNLSPFSFFNVFSANPPLLIFSPARSGKTGEQKNTYENIKEIPEVVINVVTYNIVQQVSLASSPYPKGIDEFLKAGLTPIPSEVVRPFRVKESPVQFECKVNQVIELGSQGGAGNLILCEVLKIHILEDVLSSDGLIDQHKIDLVSRMGGNWYCRSDKNSMFEIQKPLSTIGIGVDQLPEFIKKSNAFSGNELALLACIEQIPEMIGSTYQESLSIDTVSLVKDCLKNNKILAAWEILLSKK